MQLPGNQGYELTGQRESESVKGKREGGGRARSRRAIRYCSRLFRDGNESQVGLFALRERRKEEAQKRVD